jgi:hypothetical protein
MRLKIVIVDFELPPRVKRLGLQILPFALLVGVSALAYASVPKTWTAGDALKAADLNGNFASLDSRLTALETAASSYALSTNLPAVTPWTTYTPTLQTDDGQAISNATVGGAYRRVGDTIEFNIYVSFSATPTSSSTQTWTLTLPSGMACDPSKSPGGCGVSGTGEMLNPSSGVRALLVHGRNGVTTVDHIFADVEGTSASLNTTTYGTGTGFVQMFGSFPVVGWNVTP